MKMELTLMPTQRTRNGMQFFPLATTTGQDACLLLGPVGTFPATIPFEPSVFGGNGGEPRKTIRFVPSKPEQLNGILDVETKARALLEGTGTRFTWNPAITEATEFHPASIKAKIWTTGERAATVRDEHGKAITLPGQPWPRPRANALLEARGIYRTASGCAGLVLQVTALQLRRDTEVGGMTEDPFA
jgi:hypothetical protein